MKLFKMIFVFSFILIFFTSICGQIHQIKRNEYLKYATEAAEDYWNTYEKDVKNWVNRIDLKYVFGYSPPGNFIYLAYVNAHLFNITGDTKYVQRAKKCLLEIGDFRKFYPKDFWRDKPGYESGVPAVGNFFTTPMYIKAYRLLKDSKHLSQKDKDIIAENIAESCDHNIRSMEWGAMNRGVLRAEVFHLAAITLPNHPHAKTWKMISESITKDCWGKWEIEDASHYNGIHLYSLFSLIEFLDEEAFFDHAVTRYTMQFFAHLLAPYGMIPDFGDAHFNSSWRRFVAVFEKAATMYNNPELKYAASRIVNNLWDMTAERKSMWSAVIATDCYRWATDDIVPKAPPGKSELVLDDVVGKKIVFRNGYNPNDTYMLVNYKDEGVAGFMSREYLRKTIPVEEEKMTHGHSDENDISLLMVDGSILLHDGGYRDYMPSGVFGAYRSDYFHNRVVVRKDKIFKGQIKGENRYSTKNKEAIAGQSVYDFVRNSGAYREVRTELIDFLNTKNFDYSRSRIIDDKRHYHYDRIINWIKPLNIFVVFDVVKFLEDDYYTSVNFWHTRKIISHGENYFDTQYDSLRTLALPTNKSLLFYFPEGEKDGRMIGFDKENRYYQTEFAIHQTISGWHFAGDIATFTTVLIPHNSGSDLNGLMNKIELVQTDSYPKATGVKITDNGITYYICSKLDRMLDIHYNDTRPQYDYAHGKVRYDDFETDAMQLFAILETNAIEYTSVYCVKLLYNGKTLFEKLPMGFGLQFDGGLDRNGIGKVRYWQDRVVLD
jgi:hypothetical protein